MSLRMRKHLQTQRGRSFEYEETSDGSLTLHYGKKCAYRVRVPAEKLRQLVATFAGRGDVPIGTSRTDATESSLGFWLQQNVTKTAIASYVGPLLIELGYAEPGSTPDRIRIKKQRSN
jgi:hypothetical protein